MTNHGPAIQSGPLHREPLMQVNHILNILISRSGGGERGRKGERVGGAEGGRNLFRTLAGMLECTRTEGWHNEFWRASGC